MSDVKRFWMAFLLIVAGSGLLHLLVFSKLQRNQHLPESYPVPVGESEAFVPQGPPVVGEVSALGSDRFYVEAGGKRWAFYYPKSGRPPLKKQVRVLYYQGSPPTAIQVDVL